MKRLILGAVITGALGTAGATQWEYATLTIGKYLPTEAQLNDEYIYDPYYADWRTKDTYFLFTEGVPIQTFYLQMFKKDIKKGADFIEKIEFQNMIGGAGWEMVSRNQISHTAILKGQKIYALITTFYYKRPVE